MIPFLVAVGPKILSAVQFMIALGQLFPTAIKTWKEIEAATGERLKARDRRAIVTGLKNSKAIFRVSTDGGETWQAYEPGEAPQKKEPEIEL